MEKVCVPMMERLRHPPAVYLAVVAAALCWGTTHVIAKRGRSGHPLTFKRISLLKLFGVNLRPILEELVLASMALINLILGAFYWVLDFLHEGRPPPNTNYFPLADAFSKTIETSRRVLPSDAKHGTTDQQVLFKPRRGAIIRRRSMKSKSRKGHRLTCGCWGWQVDEISPMADSSWGPKEKSEKSVGVSEEGKEEGKMHPRWSECHCQECSMLLMPMSLAAGNLFVRCDDLPMDGDRYIDHYGRETLTNSDSSSEGLTFVHSPPNSYPKPLCPCLSGHRSMQDCTAVIFIHGLFSSSTFWFDTNLVPNLSIPIKSRHRVLVPDLLGCGRSPRPIDSLYSLTDQLEAVEISVIQRYGLQSFHLVGHSMGCILCLALAARCPDRVRSISLIAPVYPPRCPGAEGELDQLPCDAFFSFINPLSVKGIRALTVSKYYNISRFLGHSFYSRHKFWVSVIHWCLNGYPRSFIHDYLTNYHDAAWHITHNTLLAGTHAVIPALTKLQERGQRVLVIHGEADASCQFKQAEEMRCTFKIVDLYPVPGRGHVDVVWGREKEVLLLIEREIIWGDAQWPTVS